MPVLTKRDAKRLAQGGKDFPSSQPSYFRGGWGRPGLFSLGERFPGVLTWILSKRKRITHDSLGQETHRPALFEKGKGECGQDAKKGGAKD